MEVVVPLSGLKLSTVGGLAPGTFFMLNKVPCVRVKLDDPRYPSGFVKLDSFGLNLHRTDTQPVAMALPTETLHLQMDASQEFKEKYTPGAVHITPDGPMLVVSIPTMGGGSDIAYVSLDTWEVTREHPTSDVAFGSWTMLSRSATREDVMARMAKQ